MTKPIALVTKPSVADEIKADVVDKLSEVLAEALASKIECVVIIARRPDGAWFDLQSGVDDFPGAIGRLEITKHAWIKTYLSHYEDNA
jgi:phenylpyruvate tautomerase PptA (4-oxalocrotonate tautomerase family)